MNNEPSIWINDFPFPQAHDHKYSRGQVAVLGGMEMTGAACLSADASARVGAGLVTIISPQMTTSQRLYRPDPLLVYKMYRPYIIARRDTNISSFVGQASGKGEVVPVVGPGLGNEEYDTVRSIILSLLQEKVPIVIDADGLNAFDGYNDAFFKAAHEKVVLTPHEGEFKKLFPSLISELEKDRVKAVQEAAQLSGATVVLKGHETIIADTNKDPIINGNAQPCLATAGSGDVLSGMIAGLITQGMEPFNASCAAVWMHGHISEIVGVGLVASDIVENIPDVLKELLGIRKKVG